MARKGSHRRPTARKGADGAREFSPALQAALLDVVDTQPRDGAPPETRATLDRLVAAGYPQPQACHTQWLRRSPLRRRRISPAFRLCCIRRRPGWRPCGCARMFVPTRSSSRLSAYTRTSPHSRRRRTPTTYASPMIAGRRRERGRRLCAR